jgi:hypothetical protein
MFHFHHHTHIRLKDPALLLLPYYRDHPTMHHY